eukprot:1994101-Amphidinium_carterae.1
MDHSTTFAALVRYPTTTGSSVVDAGSLLSGNVSDLPLELLLKTQVIDCFPPCAAVTEASYCIICCVVCAPDHRLIVATVYDQIDPNIADRKAIKQKHPFVFCNTVLLKLSEVHLFSPKFGDRMSLAALACLTLGCFLIIVWMMSLFQDRLSP